MAAASPACGYRIKMLAHFINCAMRFSRGIPSHWTPYVRVDNVKDAVRQAIAFGATMIADPFVVSSVARIALIEDSVGALIGLWEPIELNMKANGHG
jgi:hypothetical protein